MYRAVHQAAGGPPAWLKGTIVGTDAGQETQEEERGKEVQANIYKGQDTGHTLAHLILSL